MAWNPSPEVAAVRDSAVKLKSQFAVLVYLDEQGRLCTASYGKTMKLCAEAGKFAEHLMAAAEKWGE